MDRNTISNCSLTPSKPVPARAPATDPERRAADAPAREPTAAQRSAEYFGWTDLAIGVLGFFGPAVTGNGDGLINVRPGKLLGITAINWAHALLHASWGCTASRRANPPSGPCGTCRRRPAYSER